MSRKSRIISVLGEGRLLLPALLNEALSANDRAKYRLTLLQTAKARADAPSDPYADLRAERLACGVGDPRYDEVVGAAALCGPDTYRLPYLRELWSALVEDLRAMLTPLREAQGVEAAPLGRRLQTLSASPCSAEDGTLSGRAIVALTAANPARGDSLHLLVMDLHRALNRLQGEIATEVLDGALSYGLAEGDRELVAAFMKGVEGTRALKFDHPGLATTATRSGKKLVIQNDIGTTDAHVLVVHVEARRVTVTYTDNHLARLLFFQGMFSAWEIAWGDVHSRTDRAFESEVYHLGQGVYTAGSKARLKDFLTHLGSRLVFLIDWNRARKRLQQLVPKKDALALLDWAAQNDIGHLGFLKAGGERMIFDALQFVGGGTLGYGVKLAKLLGREAASSYLRFILQSCTQGLLGKRSLALIRDEARVELHHYFHSAQQGLFELASEHGALAVEMAASIRDVLLLSAPAAPAAGFERLGSRTKEWERRADELVIQARELAQHSEQAEGILELLEAADDITDELEEAAFHLTLLQPPSLVEALRLPLATLSALLVEGTQEYLKALENASGILRSGSPDDMHDFLAAIHRILTIGQQSDAAERAVRRALVEVVNDCRLVFVVAESAKKLESAADALMHSAMLLRNQILGKVVIA